jgi:hypothetical protein
MQTITTIGHDIAKSVFQAHGVDVAVDIPYLEWLYKELVLQVILPPLEGGATHDARYQKIWR